MKKTIKVLQKTATGVFVLLFSAAMSGFLIVEGASAAALSAKSDTLSRLQASTAANHTIEFTTPTGVPASGTITISFPSGFNMNTLDYQDIDLKDDNVDVTLAGTPSGTTWGAVLSGQDIIFTNGSAVVAGGSVIEVEVGTHATTGSTGNTQITNHATPAEYTVSIVTSSGDSGDINIPIIADDTVNVTASVDESISFVISDTSVEFGDLSSGSVKYADDSAGSSSDAVAFNLQVGTNASGGYIVTYNGATLTSGSDTIDVASSIATGGTPGDEQFAMSIENSDNGTVTPAYFHDTPLWTFVAGTTTTIITETVPTATETFNVHLMANIDALTEAGNYSTDITYVATATF